MARDGVEATTSGMKAGGFYDAHSEYQRRVVEAGAAALERVVASLELDGDDEPLAIVDYGAGTGANSARAMGAAIRSIRSRSSEAPIVAIHNDLPTSDFGALRIAAEDDGYLGIAGGPIYSMAAAGSFFDQVVPDASVRLGTCSNAAHWYREQPQVGEFDGMYFSAALGAQRERLAVQAAADWTRFLEARARELARGGRLLVQGIGVDDEGRVSAGRLLEQMWAVALDLSGRGLLDRAVLGEYVFPVYCRSAAEAKAPMEPGGPLAARFEVVAADSQEVANPYWEMLERSGDREAYASAYAAFVRAFSESALERGLFAPGAVGVEPKALGEEFFAAFERATAADPEAGRYEAYVLTVILARR
jgi:hypothetical protein